MGMNLQERYRAKRSLVSKLCRQAMAGELPSAIMPLVPRRQESLSEYEIESGQTEMPSGVWCTTLANEDDGVKGGNTHRATVDRAAELLVFKPNSIRLALASEIEASLKEEQLRLDSRVDGARRLSVREDSAYGKRN